MYSICNKNGILWCCTAASLGNKPNFWFCTAATTLPITTGLLNLTHQPHMRLPPFALSQGPKNPKREKRVFVLLDTVE